MILIDDEPSFPRAPIPLLVVYVYRLVRYCTAYSSNTASKLD